MGNACLGSGGEGRGFRFFFRCRWGIIGEDMLLQATMGEGKNLFVRCCGQMLSVHVRSFFPLSIVVGTGLKKRLHNIIRNRYRAPFTAQGKGEKAIDVVSCRWLSEGLSWQAHCREGEERPRHGPF